MEKVLKVLAGRRITIPEEISKKLNIDEGDFVIVRLEDGSFRVIPAEVTVRPRSLESERIDASKHLAVSRL